jgi:hypothetical protein
VAVLVAVKSLVLVDAQPAEATFPGSPGNIAYTASDGTDTEIYTIDVGGGAAFRVTNNDTDDGTPSWESRA